MTVERRRPAGEAPEDVTELAEAVIEVARALWSRRLVVGSVGNVSARVTDGFLITPTRMPYHEMQADDLTEVRLTGAICPSANIPSREWPMHGQIYRARPDVSAVVHTHSPYATAWSFVPEPLVLRLEDSRYYGIDRVRTSPPSLAGSDELADAAVSSLGPSSAALLGQHGVVAVGATLDEALTIAEVVEREAHVAWLLREVAEPGAEPIHAALT